ncbi:hypothetical protein AK812_SmicGene27253 [Symbiodinium microadriaticum]|uniref:Uncharacterized protein n=1 Tax=Symbiodinium microadriaticum TaxID=2951 RepID=A0A1Q9D7A6_SYMMI|nr:hypothetical protein AK812_SmicGene27253 [Symbiodinium microadriaticum]
MRMRRVGRPSAVSSLGEDAAICRFGRADLISGGLTRRDAQGEALRQAGFQHQEKDAVEPPPGLAKGPKGFPCDVELWQSATPQQKLLLEQMGIGEPPAERPDLKTLIKTHMDQLPEALRKAVVDLDPPEPEPSATRQVEEATKRFKLATTELRLLIQKSAGLQVRIDKAKSLYGELLDQMKQLQADLKEKQDSVALLQKELEQKVQKDFDSPKMPCAFEVLLALRTAGIQLSPEQEAKLTGQALEDMEVDQNAQQAPVGAGQALRSEPPVDDKASQKDRSAHVIFLMQLVIWDVDFVWDVVCRPFFGNRVGSSVRRFTLAARASASEAHKPQATSVPALDKPAKPISAVAIANPSLAGTSAKVQHIYFDFDQTISRIHVFKQLAGWEPGVRPPHALSERGQIHRLKMMNAAGPVFVYDDHAVQVTQTSSTTASWTACALGGPERVGQLGSFFASLKASGVRLSIITKGYVGACRYLLEQEGLLQHFEQVFGMLGQFYGESDFDRTNLEPSSFEGSSDYELRKSKASLICSLMSRESLAVEEACLVEDDAQEIASVQGICRSVFVSKRRGMTESEMNELRSLASATAATVVAKPQAVAATPPPDGFSGGCEGGGKSASLARGQVPPAPPADLSSMFKSVPLEAASKPTTALTAKAKAVAQGTEIAQGGLMHVYSDFDQTLSKIHVLKQLAGLEPGVDAPHALSERGQIHRLKLLNAKAQYIYQSSNGMVVPCAAGAKGSSWTACALGGPERVGQLGSFFASLKASGVRLSIITKGYVGACRYLLEQEGLLQHFEQVFGMLGQFYGESDFDRTNLEPSSFEGSSDYELRKSKASLICSLMSRESLAVEEACLVEDDAQEIASVQGICRSVFVSKRRGMTESEMNELRSLASATAATVVAKPQAVAATPPPDGFSGGCEGGGKSASLAKGPMQPTPPADLSSMFKSVPLAAAAKPATALTAKAKAVAQGTEIAQGRLMHVYFDFDQTLSKIHVLKQLAGLEPGVDAPHARSERGQIHRLKMLNAKAQYIYQSSNGMVVPCAAGAKGSSWTACALGGPERVGQLGSFLASLKASGVRLSIITKSYVGACRYLLEQEGLLQHFEQVFGMLGQFYGESDLDRANLEPSSLEGSSDYELRESKASLIRSLMSRESLAVEEACLVEDDAQEIASVQGISRSVLVAERRGMTESEINELLSLAAAQETRPPDLRPTYCSRCWSEPACAFNRDHHLVAALIEGAIVHGCSAFEPRFLELAEMIERQACENSLEWWLGSLLLICAESSTSPAWVKPAALDLLSRQNGTAPTKVRIFSANITCWGPKIKDWVLTSIGSWDLLCIQETHLLKDIPNVEAALSSAALSHHFGPGQCSGKGGVLGGVLTVAPSHRNVRRVVEVMKEGCGFVGDELRLQGWSVVIFNVYLKSGSSLQGEINSEVLSQFLSLVNGFSVLWIAIGDFNIPAEEFASTSFPSEAKAELVSTQQPTTDHGATLDYALVSRELRGTTDISVCWDVPFKPHGLLQLCVDGSCDMPFPQLPRFRPLPDMPVRPFMLDRVPVHVQWDDLCVDDSASCNFAAWSAAVGLAFDISDGSGLEGTWCFGKELRTSDTLSAMARQHARSLPALDFTAIAHSFPPVLVEVALGIYRGDLDVVYDFYPNFVDPLVSIIQAYLMQMGVDPDFKACLLSHLRATLMSQRFQRIADTFDSPSLSTGACYLEARSSGMQLLEIQTPSRAFGLAGSSHKIP